jgi:DNA-directed RNA polymerase subunit H (RpoH/RPB5)
MYLAGTLSFLEGKYGVSPWKGSPAVTCLDSFLAKPGDKRCAYLRQAGVSERGLEALVCIRNAVVHNDSNLSKNKDKKALAKVSAAALPGVSLSSAVVRLVSTQRGDFMEYVRKSFVAVSMQHGDL